MAIIGGSGQKAATYLQPGRECYVSAGQDAQAPLSGCIRYAYSPSGAKTALSVTGSGVFQMGFFVGTNFTSQNARVTIVIDGVTVLNELKSGAIENVGMIQAGSFYYNGTSIQFATSDSIPFNTSLNISVTCSTNAYYYYRYFKT